MNHTGNGTTNGQAERFAWWRLAAARGEATEAAFARQMQSVHAGYFAGETSRYLPQPPGINPLGAGADYHYRTERQYFLMVERARFDDRDNMVVGQGVTRMCANVLRQGFTLQVETGDDALDMDLAARWQQWSMAADACDYDGERTFDQIVLSALRNTVVDGDVFLLPTAGGQIQVVENHRCRNPFGNRNQILGGAGLVHGVEVVNGRRMAYHFTSDDLEPTMSVSRRTAMRRIAARDDQGNRQVWHNYFPKRFSQRRGVTAFAPVVFPCKYHDDLQFAQLVNAKRASFIAIIRTQENPLPAGAGGIAQAGARATETRSDGTERTTEGGGPGQTIQGNPGERIQAWTPEIPAPSFFQHASLLLGIISINLDLPEMVFLLDASRTNFNGYRGVIDQARQRFEQIQLDLIQRIHSPAYTWKVRQWIADDPALARAATRGGINLAGHRWTPRGWPYIQPVQDAAADDLRLSRNLISPRRRAQERGVDYQDLCREIVEDRRKLIEQSIEAADQVNSAYPEAEVNWREIAYGTQAGVRLNLTGSIDEPEAAGGEESPS